jgi:D-tyrosyl-tRNA(Tyr) deacylase
VWVDDEVVGSIDGGLVILLGVGPDDTEAVADELARKAAELRIFRDDDGRTNRSLLEVGGGALVVSQFTLYADTRRGRRPGFTAAAPPDLAERLYGRFVDALRALGTPGDSSSAVFNNAELLATIVLGNTAANGAIVALALWPDCSFGSLRSGGDGRFPVIESVTVKAISHCERERADD